MRALELRLRGLSQRRMCVPGSCIRQNAEPPHAPQELHDPIHPNQEVDRQTWGLDDIGNWLSTTQTDGNLMQTRSHDVMNCPSLRSRPARWLRNVDAAVAAKQWLQQIGGGGSVVVEGTVNEYADITVNSVPANLFEDPLLSPPGYRYRAPVPVVTGANTITVTATDQDQDVATTQWSINVPASQRTFTYDANGNMLTDSIGRVFTWDGKNRLKTVTVAGTTYEWDYDYRDRRVREFVYASGGSKPTIPAKQFVWHDNDIVQERVGTSATAGTINRNHYFGGFTIGATVSTAAKYQTFTDHLGHVREVVASSGTSPAIGTVVTRYDYTPYQGPTKVYQFPSTNVEATFQTIGRYYHHEASGLDLALYRAYDAELGRWISEDPLGEEGGLNLYGFVGNGPTNLIDLLGLVEGDPIFRDLLTKLCKDGGKEASDRLSEMKRSFEGQISKMEKMIRDFPNSPRRHIWETNIKLMRDRLAKMGAACGEMFKGILGLPLMLMGPAVLYDSPYGLDTEGGVT